VMESRITRPRQPAHLCGAQDSLPDCQPDAGGGSAELAVSAPAWRLGARAATGGLGWSDDKRGGGTLFGEIGLQQPLSDPAHGSG